MGAGIHLSFPVLVTDAILKQFFNDVQCTRIIRKISVMCYLGAVINMTIRVLSNSTLLEKRPFDSAA